MKFSENSHQLWSCYMWAN